MCDVVRKKLESSQATSPLSSLVMLGKRAAQPAELSSSGGQHSAGKFTLVFADGGSIHPRLQPHLLHDPRLPVGPTEVQGFADEFDADIVVKVDAMSADGTTWELKCKGPWEPSPCISINLTKRHQATATTLRRSTLCGDELQLILVKTVKGKATGPEHLFFSPTDRKAVAYALFKLLLDSERSTLVVGNIGFSLSSIFRFCVEYRQETGSDVESKFELLASPDQQLLCLHKKQIGRSVVHVEGASPERIFVIQVIDEAGAASSGGAHPAGIQDAPVTLVSAARVLLKLIAEASHDQEHGGEQLASLLLYPVLRHKQTRADGTKVAGPVDMKATVRLLEDALMLAQKARRHVDVDTATKTLSTPQFEKAHKWLQRECFEKHFMHNETLKERIRQLDECPDQLSKKQKTSVRGSRPSAFKAFKKGLMGNTQLFHAVMRHGMFDFVDLQEFMVAFLQIRTEAETHHAADEEVVAKVDRECLRAEALQARRTLKMARKLAKSSEPLSTAQRALVLQLEAGELEKVTLQKNQAYGHGCGATSTSLEEVALFRVSCNQLDNYFGRSE